MSSLRNEFEFQLLLNAEEVKIQLEKEKIQLEKEKKLLDEKSKELARQYELRQKIQAERQQLFANTLAHSKMYAVRDCPLTLFSLPLEQRLEEAGFDLDNTVSGIGAWIKKA